MFLKSSYVAKHPDVHMTSERANVFGTWEYGFLAVSFVGALNVGSMQLHFDKTLYTNESNPQPPYYKDLNYEDPKDTNMDKYLASFSKKESIKTDKGVKLQKGEEIGMFNMGSTVVLVFECPPDMQVTKKEFDDMQMGEPITSFIN